MKLATLTLAVWISMLMAAAPTAQAVAIPLDGVWLELAEEKDTSGKLGFLSEWTWTSEEHVELCLTDIYVPGDIFEVYDNGVLLGVTPPFNSLFSGAFAMTPDEALMDEAFSHACWLLEPGYHAISIRTVARPALFASDPSYAGLRATSKSVPEGTPGLMAMGLALAGMARLRQRRATRP